MSVQGVIAAMDELNELHLKLIAAADEKIQAIVANDVDGVTRQTNQESRLLRQIAEAERNRAEQIDAFLKEKGIRSQLNLNITEISRLVFDAQEKQQLLAMRDTLLATANTLRQKNETVKMLLEQSMEFIDFSLGVLIGDEDDMIYQNPSQQTSGYKKITYFDAKA